MAEESLSIIVEQSLKSESLLELKDAKKTILYEPIFAVIKLITGDVIGSVESIVKGITDYKEREFFRKYAIYLFELVDTTQEERHKFCQEVQEKADDTSGNVILGIVDRLDNINKETILGKLTLAKIHGFISIEDFFRLCSLLERIPYVDLKELPRYKEPFYDENGDTELLYSTGALVLHTLDSNGSSKYILSLLGEKFILWGLGIHIEIEREQGTNVSLNNMLYADIDEIVDEKIKESRPKFENDTLYFPDGTKSGKMEDDDLYLYDLARGK